MIEKDLKQTVYQLFENQVAQTPDVVAVIFRDEQLTYRELNQKANQLAHYLRTLGVGPEVLVGVCVERSLEMVIALLAVFKAGGAYVPLDPAYPRERIAVMLEDSQVPVLLTLHHHQATLPAHTSQAVCLDTDWDIISQESSENPMSQVQPHNLAYIIYTSGSTGKPKGVMIPHRSLVNFVNAASQEYEIGTGDRVLQFASISFDAAVEEIFPTLSHGATLVLRTKDMLRSIPAFLKACLDWQLTVLDLPTAFWHKICVEFPIVELPATVRLVIIGGERALPQYLTAWEKHVSPHIRLVNTYGPTEATVVATWCDLAGSKAIEAGQRLLPIGIAIPNIQTYVLDKQLHPVDPGVAGELYIAGAGLARGYLNHPALTAVKFIYTPSLRLQKIRLYKTGDLVRYRKDGQLEFLGRLDRQEKIRGFRIELREIETILEQHPVIREAVVIAREEVTGDKHLVAYMVQRSEVLTQFSPIPWLHMEEERIAQWQVIHNDDSFNPTESHWDPTFNIGGWVNSYTGQPIPELEMREWVNNTVARILSLQPQRVLEIGCGNGLMLFGVAPHCLEYTGTDFSQATLNYIQQQLTRPELHLPQVNLSQRTADNFRGLEPHSFDTVIINSVIQYFPSVHYLIRVLEEAMRVVEPGGFIFVGDIRSYPLLKAFATSVELSQAADNVPIEELRRRIRKRIRQEEELTIDPAFFPALQQQFPQISQVQVLLKEGHYHNELNHFRYDVILQIGSAPSRPLTEHSWLDWQQQQLTVPELCQILQRDRPEALGIRKIPNARVLSDVQMVELLASQDCPNTVRALRQISIQQTQGVDPEELWKLSRDLPYEIFISWLGSGADGSYDILLQRRTSATYENPPRIISSQPARTLTLKPWHAYANNPLQRKITHSLIPKLRAFLKEKLPDYMLPSAFVVVDDFPITPNGKVDQSALPAPDPARLDLDEEFIAPRNPLEQQLRTIWSQVLGIEQIGIYDDFFELGGDSLQIAQLISQVEANFLASVPLLAFFQTPTIAGMAKIIQRVCQTEVATVQIERMTLQQLQAEAALSFAVRPHTPIWTPPVTPQAVFLTGATGFVGTFVLYELLVQTEAMVYCLVRAQSYKEGGWKLRHALARCLPGIEIPYSRIIPIIGDLTQPLLGLTEEQFQELASIIDGIYHSGANVNLLYPYAALRSANVVGTREVLRLASQVRTKPVHYISTLDVFESLVSTGTPVIYEKDSIAKGNGIASGYAQSKWVAEQLVTIAGSRGLPVNIYRPGMVTGHSQTGIANIEDFICRWIKSSIQLKVIPNLELMIDMTPVDYVSQAIVYLSLQPESYGKAFHLVNPQPLALNDFARELNVLGYPVQQIQYDRWKVALNQTSNALSPLAPVITKQIAGHQLTHLEIWLAGSQVFDCQNTINGLAGSTISCPPTNPRLLRTYLSYLMQNNFMEVPNLYNKRPRDKFA